MKTSPRSLFAVVAVSMGLATASPVQAAAPSNLACAMDNEALDIQLQNLTVSLGQCERALEGARKARTQCSRDRAHYVLEADKQRTQKAGLVTMGAVFAMSAFFWLAASAFSRKERTIGRTITNLVVVSKDKAPSGQKKKTRQLRHVEAVRTLRGVRPMSKGFVGRFTPKP